MFADEIEHGAITFGVAHDARVIAQLQQANVTVMILQRLDL